VDSGGRRGEMMQVEEGDPFDRDSKTLSDSDERRHARRPTVLLGFSGEHHWRMPLPETGRIILGRGEGCDRVLEDARVSRKHCSLHLSKHVRLEDLGSTTGTRLMGRTLEQGEKAFLKRGDVFEIGDTSIVCLVSTQSGASIGAGQSPAVFGRRGGRTAMATLRWMTERIAHSQINVLISGETGVGKGVLAAELHRRSNRAERPFVALNCAELQESLLESELFGHERGAFTGAGASKPGLIETADGGTLFLDEIGEMSLGTQAKLLRVLEDRSVRRVGSLQARHIDVRVLAASNRDLAAESERGTFRRDLYFRLNGISLEVPPLRDRLDELEGLVHSFLAQASEAQGQPQTPSLSAEALEALRRHTWPGNIRELRNVIERAVVLCTGEVITAEHLPVGPEIAPNVVPLSTRAHAPDAQATDPTLLTEQARAERQRIEEALDLCAGNQSRAAKMLGVSRATLVARLDRYGFPRPRKRTG
jgi:two-component system, NtrC family, response regulator AtoC